MFFRISGFFILCLVLAMPASAAAPSAYTLEKPSDVSSVELSPSGKFVAFISIQTGKFCLDKYGTMVPAEKAKCKENRKEYRSTHKVNIYDLENSKPFMGFPVPENFYISWLEWASDDRILMSVRRPTTIGSGKRGYSLGGSRILSVSMSNENSRVALFEDQKRLSRRNRYLSRITNLLRNDPDHIIMPATKGGDLDLWKVNLVDGGAVRIAQGKSGTFYWYTDSDGTPSLRFDCSSQSCRRINVYAYKSEVDEWTKIKSFKVKPDSEEDDYDFWPIAPVPGKKQYYVISNEDDDARRAIKIYDLEKDEYIKTVFEHPSVDVSGAVRDLQSGNYAGAWYYEDRLQYSLIDKTMQKHIDALNTFFNNKENVKSLGFSANGKYAMFYVSSPNNPGEYYLYNFASKQVDRLLTRKQDLPGRFNSNSEIVKIPTRDGSTVTAYHTYPKGKKSAQTPLLVMPHGGPEARDYYNYNSEIQYFVSRGYQVLQVNFRGSGGFGRAFAKAGYGQWGGVMQDDVTDAVKYLHDQNFASADKTCIVGYSYGGYAALYGAATTPELYRCVVSGGGVSDLLADLKTSKSEFGKDSETYEYWLKSMGDPKADRAKLAAVSPVNLADKFQSPVLLIHGEDDEVVNISQAKSMYKALKKAGKNVEFIQVEDETHSRWYLKNQITYLETIENFLRQHIGAP